MPEEGWYSDPYRVHEQRWFSDGTPTILVRDRGTTSKDVRGHEKVPAGGHLRSPLVATKVPTCGHEKSPPLTEPST